MNKAQLIDAVANAADISKKDASQAVDAVVTQIKESLAGGDTVTLIGFGTFAVRERAERKGRNPRTNEEIVIPSAKVPVFKPGKALKEALN